MEEKIKEIAGKLGMGYIFEDWSRANIKADKETTFPILINVLPVSGSMKFSRGMIYDSPNCLFAFLDKTEFDYDGKENDRIVNRMKDLSKRFIRELNESGVVEPIDGEINYQVLYDKLNVNVTGVSIELRLQDAIGVCEEQV